MHQEAIVNKVGIVGLGNMGEAILRALLASGVVKEDIVCFEIKPERRRVIEEKYGVEMAGDQKDLANRSAHILLAVKPQDSKMALQGLAAEIDESKILISIMAGVTTSAIISILDKPVKVVRVMPNICVAVAQGALGISPNYLVTKDELEFVVALLTPLGLVVDITEEQMDAVTALGGSGPAFVLSFLEALIDGGVRMGLARDKARKLAVQTIKGTIAMLEKGDLHPTLMKETVTSPGGTTIAGLVILDERGFKGTVIRSLEAAQVRAKELSK
jgi:pyrroline-5-carboxylate reductase